jgi:hypothetical protein
MPLPLAALGIMGAGAAAGGLSSLFRKKPRQENISRLTPQQLGWQSEAGNMAMQGLKNPYEGFQPIEQNAREQFQTSTIPSLAERFTSMGNGQRSSAFQGALGQAGAGLESNLAGLRSQYGLQNRGLSQNLLGQAMQPSFDTMYQQHQPGFLESSLGGLSGTLGQYGAMKGLGMFGNGMGQQGGGMGGLPPQIMQLLQSPKFLAFLQQNAGGF